jgi:hypothetical protein
MSLEVKIAQGYQFKTKEKKVILKLPTEFKDISSQLFYDFETNTFGFEQFEHERKTIQIEYYYDSKKNLFKPGKLLLNTGFLFEEDVSEFQEYDYASYSKEYSFFNLFYNT